MIFQIAVLTYVAVTYWRATVDWRKRRISQGFFLLILLTHGPLIPITLQPDITTWAASHAGIGRGADFVIYCAMLMIGRWLLALYRWNIRLESEITELVRQFALSEGSARASAAEHNKATTGRQRAGMSATAVVKAET